MGKKTLNRIISISLLALFCSYLGSITLFPHTHLTDRGFISHSHPYSGTGDNPGHSHSTIQYDTIAQLSTLLLVLAVVSGLAAIFLQHSTQQAIYRTTPQLSVSVLTIKQRGPPTC